jgi:hypothetical protein
VAVLLGIALAIISLLLPLSVYPGLLPELAFLAMVSSPFWLPAACLSWWVFADTAHDVPDLFSPPTARRRWPAAATLLLVISCGFLWWDVPRRLAFLPTRGAFESCLAGAPAAYSSDHKFDRRFGMYHVDRLATDPRGGIYFRTRSSPDGFHASTMSYGFSHQPNPSGSPFGDEKYTLAHVVGDWYSFQASER